MNVVMVGSHMCQDTLFALMQLRSAGADVDFRDIHNGFPSLLEFLKLRDESPLYEGVKKNGGIGMPYFRLEDGTETLDLNEVIGKLK